MWPVNKSSKPLTTCRFQEIFRNYRFIPNITISSNVTCRLVLIAEPFAPIAQIGFSWVFELRYFEFYPTILIIIIIMNTLIIILAIFFTVTNLKQAKRSISILTTRKSNTMKCSHFIGKPWNLLITFGFWFTSSSSKINLLQ